MPANTTDLDSIRAAEDFERICSRDDVIDAIFAKDNISKS